MCKCYICGKDSLVQCESCDGWVCYGCCVRNNVVNIDYFCRDCFTNLMFNGHKYTFLTIHEIYKKCKPIMQDRIKRINEIENIIKNEKI